MIHPLLTRGRFLFVRNNCDYCAIWKKFIFKLNSEIKQDKRIRIIDCTKYDEQGVCDNPVIKLFEKYLDGYPVLFFEGEMKSGAHSVIECEAWLRSRMFNDFYFQQIPEHLPNIDKPVMFNLKCKHRKGRIECE